MTFLCELVIAEVQNEWKEGPFYDRDLQAYFLRYDSLHLSTVFIVLLTEPERFFVGFFFLNQSIWLLSF